MLDRTVKPSKNVVSPLSSEERRIVLNELFVFGKDNQLPHLKRMAFLLVVSTLIACCGLMSDSAAVVIGAMLVAPMMRPVMSAAAAISLGWSGRLYESIALAFVMGAVAVTIASVFAFIAPDLSEIPEQVLARTRPTFFDLVIALAAGSGGAYTMTRRESNAIPGVAMAVALLPPLASTGILFIFAEFSLALKAFVLFFTNFAAMVLAGALTFFFVGVKPNSSGQLIKPGFIRNGLIAFLLLVVGVSIPLYFYSNEVWYDAFYRTSRSAELQRWLSENDLAIENVSIDDERQILHLELTGPSPPLNIEFLHRELERVRTDKLGRTDPFSIEVVWIQSVEISWPPVDGSVKQGLRLSLDHSEIFHNTLWKWVGTQYADGAWLRPGATARYIIQGGEKNSFSIVTPCGEAFGNYQLNQKELDLTELENVKESSCANYLTAQRFLTDLKQVVTLSHNENVLSLGLSNDNGAIYREKLYTEVTH